MQQKSAESWGVGDQNREKKGRESGKDKKQMRCSDAMDVLARRLLAFTP